jgi:hypothetical protein
MLLVAIKVLYKLLYRWDGIVPRVVAAGSLLLRHYSAWEEERPATGPFSLIEAALRERRSQLHALDVSAGGEICQAGRRNLKARKRNPEADQPWTAGDKRVVVTSYRPTISLPNTENKQTHSLSGRNCAKILVHAQDKELMRACASNCGTRPCRFAIAEYDRCHDVL